MAVNSYRFIAMYVIIGMIITTITLISQDTSNTTKVYDLNPSDRMREISSTGDDIYTDSATLIQSNQYLLSQTYGDQVGLGKNWVQALKNGFIPYGLIPQEQMSSATELEKSLNLLLIWFRIFILVFAGFELFQMILRKVT